MAKIPPKLLASIKKKLEDLSFIKKSFKKSGILGPNTYKDVLDFMNVLKNKDKLQVNTKKQPSRKR